MGEKLVRHICINCVYYSHREDLSIDEAVGDCHRFPETKTSLPVKINDWCGEFKRGEP